MMFDDAIRAGEIRVRTIRVRTIRVRSSNLVSTFLLLALVPIGFLPAQQVARTGVLYGSVLTDPNDRPVSGAEVRVGPTLSARTDSAGEFAIKGISPGAYQVVVRHFGNKAISTEISFSAGDSLGRDFVLSVEIPDLDTVRVAGKAAYPQPAESGRMIGFATRKRMGFGRILDTLVFQREQSRRLSDVLRSYMSASIVDMGSSAAIATRSGALSFRELPSGDASDARRGAKRACYSQVFVDGLKVYEPEPGRSLFDINSLSPNQLQGAEFYSGPASTPTQYGGLGASCGTLLLWTK
jgi:Carboxypeptidase regulatory-like domain/TonB-dependent Receptor Plug Domain